MAWSVQAHAHGSLHSQIEATSARIARTPGDARLLLHRAELKRQHEDWDAALADCERAAALDPTLETLDLVRGRILVEAGRAAPAREALDRFLQAHPHHLEALLARARARGALGDFEGSAADYGQAIGRTTRPDPEWVVQQAVMLERAGRPLDALDALDAGLLRLGSLASLQGPAIDLEVKLGRLDAALARLDRLASGSPRQEFWLARRGDILVAFGQVDAARQARSAALAALHALPAMQRSTPAMKSLELQLKAALGS